MNCGVQSAECGIGGRGRFGEVFPDGRQSKAGAVEQVARQNGLVAPFHLEECGGWLVGRARYADTSRGVSAARWDTAPYQTHYLAKECEVARQVDAAAGQSDGLRSFAQLIAGYCSFAPKRFFFGAVKTE